MQKSSLLITPGSALHQSVMEALEDLGFPITEYRFAQQCADEADDQTTIIFYAVQKEGEAISVLKRIGENKPNVPVVILTDNPAIESACWNNGAKAFFLTTELHLLKEILKRINLIE